MANIGALTFLSTKVTYDVHDASVSGYAYKLSLAGKLLYLKKSAKQDSANKITLGGQAYMIAKPTTANPKLANVSQKSSETVVLWKGTEPPVVTPPPIDEQIENRRPDASLTGPRITTLIPFTGAVRSNTTYTGRSFKGGQDWRNLSDIDAVDCEFDAAGSRYCVRCDDRETTYERQFEFCEFKNFASAAIYGGGFSCRNSHVHHSKGDGFKPTHDALIEGNLVEMLGMSEGSHADGVQIRGGWNIIIRLNFFNMPQRPDTSTNAAVFCQKDSNGVKPKDIAVDRNWCIGGNYTVQLLDSGVNCTATNNVFYPGTPRYGFGRLMNATWSGNVTDTGKPATTNMK